MNWDRIFGPIFGPVVLLRLWAHGAKFDFSSRPNPSSSILPPFMLALRCEHKHDGNTVAARRETASNQNLSSLHSTCNTSPHMLRDDTENNKEGKHPNTADHM